MKAGHSRRNVRWPLLPQPSCQVNTDQNVRRLCLPLHSWTYAFKSLDRVKLSGFQVDCILGKFWNFTRKPNIPKLFVSSDWFYCTPPRRKKKQPDLWTVLKPVWKKPPKNVGLHRLNMNDSGYDSDSSFRFQFRTILDDYCFGRHCHKKLTCFEWASS